jgi:hypothetical protein
VIDGALLHGIAEASVLQFLQEIARHLREELRDDVTRSVL